LLPVRRRSRKTGSDPKGVRPLRRLLQRPPIAPFDSLRDWIAAAEAHGLVQRVDAIDQDASENKPGTFLRYFFEK
jgi:hypothetical protein